MRSKICLLTCTMYYIYIRNKAKCGGIFFALAVTYPGEILLRILGMEWVFHEARYHHPISEHVTVIFRCLFHT